MLCFCYAGILWCSWTFSHALEGRKKCNNARNEYSGKKINPVYHRTTTWSGMHSSLLVYVMQWQKSLHAQSKKQGEESLPWIQNQILWDLLEFDNKHLQTLLIQYSIWRTWIKPTLHICFPIRWIGKQRSIGESPTKSWHFSKFERAHWMTQKMPFPKMQEQLSPG